MLQAKQDKNAERSAGAAAASRAVAKASGVYSNADWDLVDARKAGKLKGIKKSALPSKLRGMNKSQLNAYIDKLEKQRKSIRAKILTISKKRSAWLSKEMKRQGKTHTAAFDGAVRRAVRVQAKAKGIRLK